MPESKCCGNATRIEGGAELLIVGVGNLLCGDDGLGATAVLELQRRYLLPDGVAVLDGGTLGLALLPYVSEAKRVIVIDAVLSGGAPGALVRLGSNQMGGGGGRFSGHEVGVADLIAALELAQIVVPELVLLGLVPRTLHSGVGLSVEVQQALPELLAAVVTEAHRFGFTLLPA